MNRSTDHPFDRKPTGTEAAACLGRGTLPHRLRLLTGHSLNERSLLLLAYLILASATLWGGIAGLWIPGQARVAPLPEHAQPQGGTMGHAGASPHEDDPVDTEAHVLPESPAPLPDPSLCRGSCTPAGASNSDLTCSATTRDANIPL